MNDIWEYATEIIVLMLVAFPPFLYLFRYVCDRLKNNFARALIFILYWGLSLWTSNIVPAAAVIFLIWRSRVEDNGMYEQGHRSFSLDARGDRWRFSLPLFVRISLLGILIKILVSYANTIAVAILQLFHAPLENQAVVNEFLNANIYESIYYFLLISICAPVVEEFVFRFWMYDRVLKKRTNKYIAAVFTSLLFMGAHFNIQGAFAFFLVGLINCFLYERNGYWAAVANHFMFNFSTVLVLVAAKVFNVPIT